LGLWLLSLLLTTPSRIYVANPRPGPVLVVLHIQQAQCLAGCALHFACTWAVRDMDVETAHAGDKGTLHRTQLFAESGSPCLIHMAPQTGYAMYVTVLSYRTA
jgi:hypothetical protein